LTELLGQIFQNRYRLDSFLGRGGMADVYKVWDQKKAVYLAMKILHSDLSEDRLFLRRFKREAETLSRLQHPHIVRYYGFETEGRIAFILMDYIEGISLRTRIFDLERPFSNPEMLEIIQPVCSALHYAHQSGVVHCDIKPANIMLQKNGGVLVSDFGISRLTEAATATLVGAGTPAYMSPEQARGEELTPLTDIYSLGIVLYEMLSGGERPFTGEHARTKGSTSEKVRWEQVHSVPPPLRQVNPKVTESLEIAVMKFLEKEPANRPASPLDAYNLLCQSFETPPIILAEKELIKPSVEETGIQQSEGGRKTPISSSSKTGTTLTKPEYISGWLAILIILGGFILNASMRTGNNPSSNQYSLTPFANSSVAAHTEEVTQPENQSAITTPEVITKPEALLRNIVREVISSPGMTWPLGINNANLIFGPEDGSLEQRVGGSSGGFFTKVNTKNFIAAVTFINPVNRWDYEILFRKGDTSNYSFSIFTDGTWSLSLNSKDQNTLIRNSRNKYLNVKKDEKNTIWLIVENKSISVFVNGKYDKTIPLGFDQAGEVVLATGLWPGNAVEGELTFFSDFTIWELP